MENSIILNSAVSTATSENRAVQPQRQQRAVSSESKELGSFALIARISNSARLSDNEKNILVGNVAIVDKFAQGSFREKLLSEITATALYIENYSSVRKGVAPVEVKQPVNTQNVGVRVRGSLDQSIKQVKEDASVKDAVRAVSRERVQEARTGVAESRPVQDVVAAQIPNVEAEEFVLPGSGEPSREVAEAIALASEVKVPEVNFEPLPIPGAGADVGVEALTLPGEGGAEVAPIVVPEPVQMRMPGEAAVKQFRADDLRGEQPTTVKFA